MLAGFTVKNNLHEGHSVIYQSFYKASKFITNYSFPENYDLSGIFDYNDGTAVGCFRVKKWHNK